MAEGIDPREHEAAAARARSPTSSGFGADLEKNVRSGIGVSALSDAVFVYRV